MLFQFLGLLLLLRFPVILKFDVAVELLIASLFRLQDMSKLPTVSWLRFQRVLLAVFLKLNVMLAQEKVFILSFV